MVASIFAKVFLLYRVSSPSKCTIYSPFACLIALFLDALSPIFFLLLITLIFPFAFSSYFFKTSNVLSNEPSLTIINS
mgnify:CR=1 FL=1